MDLIKWFLRLFSRSTKNNELTENNIMSKNNNELGILLENIETLSGNNLKRAKSKADIVPLMASLEKLLDLVKDKNVEQKDDKSISEMIKDVKFHLSSANKLNRNVKEIVDHKLNDIFHLIPTYASQELRIKGTLSLNSSETSTSKKVTEDIQGKTNADTTIKILNESDDNHVNIIALLAKIDRIPTEFNVQLKKINEHVVEMKNENKGNVSALNQVMKTIISKVDDNTKLSISDTRSIKSELNEISKLIPKDVLKKSDFDFFSKDVDNKLKTLDTLKEAMEDFETLPKQTKDIKAELLSINEKLDNISVSSISVQSSVKVPDEVQAVEDLAKYMRDGVAQFENMSRLYVSKMSELEKLEEIKEQHKAKILKAEKESAEQGKLEANISLAKEIADKFPSEFKEIKSIFESVITEKYSTGEIINVTNENKNEMMPYFSTELELVEYEVSAPAILIGSDIIFPANIKKIPQRVTKSISPDETSEIRVDSAPEMIAEDASKSVAKED